ncbi:MAG: UDP-N-acetylmuramoylalanine--D-glutamate ligase, partial [uncultured Thermomicrobiales bacterium]
AGQAGDRHGAGQPGRRSRGGAVAGRRGGGRHGDRREGGRGAGGAAGRADRVADPVRPRRPRRAGLHPGRRRPRRPQPGGPPRRAPAAAGAGDGRPGRDGDLPLPGRLPGARHRHHRHQGQNDGLDALRRDAAALAAGDGPGRQHGRLGPGGAARGPAGDAGRAGDLLVAARSHDRARPLAPDRRPDQHRRRSSEHLPGFRGLRRDQARDHRRSGSGRLARRQPGRPRGVAGGGRNARPRRPVRPGRPRWRRRLARRRPPRLATRRRGVGSPPPGQPRPARRPRRGQRAGRTRRRSAPRGTAGRDRRGAGRLRRGEGPDGAGRHRRRRGLRQRHDRDGPRRGGGGARRPRRGDRPPARRRRRQGARPGAARGRRRRPPADPDRLPLRRHRHAAPGRPPPSVGHRATRAVHLDGRGGRSGTGRRRVGRDGPALARLRLLRPLRRRVRPGRAVPPPCPGADRRRRGAGM